MRTLGQVNVDLAQDLKRGVVMGDLVPGAVHQPVRVLLSVPGKNPEYGKADGKGFVGVDPVYANYANATDAPLEATEEEEDLPESPKEEKKTARKPAGMTTKSGQ